MIKLKELLSEIKSLPKRSLEYWIKIANSRKKANKNIEIEALFKTWIF